MSYNEFIQYHPTFGFSFELFKGIMPTIVALLAIYINNKNANKREKEKIEKDIKTKALTQLQNDAIQLNNMLFDAGKEFLDYIHCLDDKEKSERAWAGYYRKVSEAIMFSKRIMFISDMEIIKTGDQEVQFHDCFQIVSKFPDQIADMAKEFNKKAAKTLKKMKANLLMKYNKN